MMHDSENVKVCVRCRPMSEKEELQKFLPIVKIDEDFSTVSVKPPNHKDFEHAPPKVFTFDFVFGVGSKQLDIYNKIARPIVEQVFEGYNGTIFAYGQTGTGKTFTMEGIRNMPALRGIIPNSFAHIFGRIAKADPQTRFLVHVSYLEIYNEEVRDLLGKNQQTKLDVKERPDCGVYVKDLSTAMVHSPNEMEKLMSLGNKNRVTAATQMNAHSSRSHAIFSVTVECCELIESGKNTLRQGKLHLVDLAGSERQSKTGSTGQRLLEANKINLSLTTLGNVISALVDGKSTHVPYRNSKLTRLLQDSLGGNSKTVMIANIGPTDYNYDESISTLRYANRAKSIKNNARINEDPKDALLRQFQKELEDLRKQLGDGGVCLPVGLIESEGEEYEIGTDGGELHRQKRKTPESKKLTKEQIDEIQKTIEADRQQLEEQKDMEVHERDKIKKRLQEKESELLSAKKAQDDLKQRMAALEKRIIVGGENLLEKAEAQERLLEESAKELKTQTERAQQLKQKLKEKKEERINIEEKYSSLQEEAAGKRKKLQKLTTMHLQMKSEVDDLRSEHVREMEGLLENIRQLSRELQLQNLIIDHFIPKPFQDLIEQNVNWNEDIGEWQLKCIAYSGNNMHKPEIEENESFQDTGIADVYLSFGSTMDGSNTIKAESKTKQKKNRKSANKSNLYTYF